MGKNIQKSPHRKQSDDQKQQEPELRDPSLYADIEALQQKAKRMRMRLQAIEQELNLLRSEIQDPETPENTAKSV